MISYSEWIIKNESILSKQNETGAGAGVPYAGQSAGCCGTWQGAAGGGQLSSVGPVKVKKKKKK